MTEHGSSTTAPGAPPVVDRATWRAERDALLVREKAYTREGDTLAAARRRLPMVEVDAAAPLVGPDGPTTLLAAFEGRQQLIAYFFTNNAKTVLPIVEGVVDILGVRTPRNEIFTAVVCCLVIALLWVLVNRTRTGKAVLAASMNPRQCSTTSGA